MRLLNVLFLTLTQKFYNKLMIAKMKIELFSLQEDAVVQYTGLDTADSPNSKM